MNSTIVWHLLWKEYRTHRSLWLMIALLTASVQLLLLATAAASRWIQLDTEILVIGMSAGAFYALGCGALLFAGERAVGTDRFQQSLPIRTRELLSGKLLFALASTFALMLFMWLWTIVLLRGGSHSAIEHRPLWEANVILAVDLLVWSIFFSLLTSRPLLSVVLASAAGFLTTLLCISLNGFGQDPQAGSFVGHVQTRLAVTVLIFLCDILLARSWLLGLSQGRGYWKRLLAADRAARSARKPVAVSPVRSLIWQQVRSEWRTAIAIGLPSLLGLLLVINREAEWNRGLMVLGAAVSVILLGALAGSCTFFGDQQNHAYRFFAERAIPAHQVWFTRQLFWFSVLAAWTATYLLLAPLLLSLVSSRHSLLRVQPNATEWLPHVLLCGFLAYCAGQLCSMLFRSGVLGVVTGILLAGLVCFWAALMHAFRLPLWAFVCPLPIMLAGATYLRAEDWILERHGWRARNKILGVVAVPALLLLAGAIAYRAWEIPKVVVPGAVEDLERSSVEAIATATLYDQALSQLRSKHHSALGSDQRAAIPSALLLQPLNDVDPEWVQANSASLEFAVRAAMRDEVVWTPRPLIRQHHEGNRVLQLGELIIARGTLAKNKGDLEEALKGYLAALRMSAHLRRSGGWFEVGQILERAAAAELASWALDPRQTPELLHQGLDQLHEAIELMPPLSYSLSQEYILQDAYLNVRIGAVGRELGMLRSWMPWEFTRLRRLLAYIAHRQIQHVAGAEQQLESEGTLPRAIVPDPRELAWLQTTPQLPRDMRSRAELHVYQVAMDYLRRRGLEVIFAVALYRAERGTLPASLEQLVEENYLDAVPFDPLSGEPFQLRQDSPGHPILDLGSAGAFGLSELAN